MYVSPNAVQGSLADSALDRLLAVCRKQMLTGRIDVETDAGPGHVELRAGMIHEAEMAGHHGSYAVAMMRALRDGSYQICQRLPGPGGALGSAASFRGEVTQVSLVELMRHCEDNALTCTITVVHEFDRAQVVYRAGEIVGVTLNGKPDEDALVELIRCRDARFLVSAPPLDLEVDGWPVVRRAPTEPFRVHHLTEAPPAAAPQVPRARTATAELSQVALVPRVVADRGEQRAGHRPRRRGLRARAGQALRQIARWVEQPRLRPITAVVVDEPVRTNAAPTSSAHARPEPVRDRSRGRPLIRMLRRWLSRR